MLTQRLSRALTSRRGSRVSLGIALVLIVLIFGAFSSAAAPAGNESAPADSESARVDQLLTRFPDADLGTVLVVAERADGSALTAGDEDALSALSTELADTAPSARVADSVRDPMVSDDGRAAVITTALEVGQTNTETSDVVDDLRSRVEAALADTGLRAYVTGGPAFGADIAGAFDGADITLLAVTILIVAALLIVTYRSPVLWLIPLVVVAIADRAASILTNVAGAAFDLQFDAGIISVLVFGAGTNYALLLISRYREELHTHDDHRAALAAAWRHTAPAILASNVTVILSLSTLALAVIPGTRGLGIAAAVGLLVALAAVLLVLPPVLAMCGRRVFWPVVPTPGTTPRIGRVWHAVAERVSKRPAAALVGGLAVLGIMATGLFGTSVGLTQIEKFRVASDSATGLEVLGDHFDAGNAQPILVVADTDHADAVLTAAQDTGGVLRARIGEESTDGTLTQIVVTGEAGPGEPASLELVRDLRASVGAIDGAGALVGGQIATDVDARAGNQSDLLLIAPLILAVSFLVLIVLLRSLVAPFLLLAINIASATAAIGAGAWLSRVLLDQHALDLQVPLLSFLFLVALGIDYTIFLVHRARLEARTKGTKEGIVAAVTGTGAVITSAGLVLAGVFAALGVLPLVTLGQLGLIVGLGVVIDTVLVRTIVVPATFTLLGDRMWWPGRNPAETDPTTDDTQPETTHVDHPARV
ncbi:MMPL family transporter [Pseudactinotalea sp. HY158]|uniref:MMPL family transporter n=1 Tax=Pseudactinotalea sp. HY158 TaxID=2654547 RepID=UPI00129C2B3D|nr:MMPL family transporter [Pseudactinotalea sp. HY158]QGH68799.1 MMPL family transporter [Pseudactinotalea sp. HY158]